MRPSLLLRPRVILLAPLFFSSCLLPRPILFAKEVPFAQNTGVQPPECQVKGITKLVTGGTRPDWSPDGRLIFYDGLVKGNHELFRMNADGSNQQCLTCMAANIPQELSGKHKGVVTVNPDGKHIVFFAENEYGTHKFTNTPGFGHDNDFWATDFDGQNFWRLTRQPKDSALQFPRFSFDGKQFTWSDPIEKGNVFQKGREYGIWRLKIADFVVTQAGPRFANIIELQPAGKGYYEAHGFSPDGNKIIFTAMVDPAKSQYYGEIYAYDLTTRTLTNLAKADDLHFEQSIYTPSGKKISFMSGPFIGLARFVYKTDLYLMDADGSNRVRLTYFNEPGHPESTGTDTLMNKHNWSPDGTKIAGGYYIHKRRDIALFIVAFRGPCGKL